eukprot:1955631-Pyramimonas_sp.AAC.1
MKASHGWVHRLGQECEHESPFALEPNASGRVRAQRQQQRRRADRWEYHRGSWTDLLPPETGRPRLGGPQHGHSRLRSWNEL